MDQKSKKIVIIEDDPILLKALNLEFSGQSFKILSAMDGQSGLKMVKREKPDLLILDLLLPKIHGLEILSKLRRSPKTNKMSVIILTNLKDVNYKIQPQNFKTFDYYIKSSLDLSQLSKRIRQILFQRKEIRKYGKALG